MDVFLSPHHQAHGRYGSSPGSAEGALAIGASLLSSARARRRGPYGSRQECLLHRESSVPHGPGAEALRLHALDAIRRCSVAGRQQVQRHDLPAHRDLGRRRSKCAQPGADGAGGSKGQSAGRVRRGACSETGKSLDELRDYVDEHPKLKHALYQVPHREGIAGTAAQFAWHVSDLMDTRQIAPIVGREVVVSARQRSAATPDCGDAADAWRRELASLGAS